MSDNYHSDYSSVSKTMLNLFYDSPQDFYLTYITREKQPKGVKKRGVIGSILHAMILEDAQMDDCVLVYPDDCLKSNGDLNGKSAAEFRADNTGYHFLKAEEYGAVDQACKAIMARPDIQYILANATSREQRYDAELCGVPCKCKPDILCERKTHIEIVDIKCMECIYPDQWRRSSKRFRYWLQQAHYSSVVTDALGKRVVWKFLAIETVFPFRTQWYEYANEVVAIDSHRNKLTDLKRRMDTGDWADNWESVTTVEPWDTGDDEVIFNEDESDG